VTAANAMPTLPALLVIGKRRRVARLLAPGEGSAQGGTAVDRRLGLRRRRPAAGRNDRGDPSRRYRRSRHPRFRKGMVGEATIEPQPGISSVPSTAGRLKHQVQSTSTANDSYPPSTTTTHSSTPSPVDQVPTYADRKSRLRAAGTPAFVPSPQELERE